MAGYDIGISGLDAAQRALSVIGNNIANSATEGFHRQDIDLRPADEAMVHGTMIGRGVNFAGIRRQVNAFLESEIVRQQSMLSALERRSDSLNVIETALGELTETGLSTALDNFFGSMYELSLRPADVSLQTAVISAAESLTTQIGNLGIVLGNLQESFYTEAQNVAAQINDLSAQIARLNQQIYNQQVNGQDASNIMDQRDQLIKEIGEKVGVRTYTREYGIVDVVVAEIPLVVGTVAGRVQIGLVENGGAYRLGIAPEGTESYSTEVSGGTLGALFELRNSIIGDIQGKFDRFTQTLISEVNKLHLQGVGSAGSFTSLTGWTMNKSSVADFVPPVTDGVIHIRVTDPSGAIRCYSVAVNSSSTLQSVAADLAAVPGLEDNTGVNADRLQIVANTGYKFDFVPGVLPTPTATVPSPLAGAGVAPEQAPPAIAVSGLYTGDVNQIYTCTVNTAVPGDTLAIGNGSMELVVTDGSGTTVAKLQIGSEYVPGTALVIDEGIEITLGSNGASPGCFNDGDVFTIEALADSDTSGFLAAVGMNVFFTGSDSSSIGLSDAIRQSGSRIAVSRGAEGTDNRNILALARLGDKTLDGLGNLNLKDYYRQIAVNVGEQLSVTRLQYENGDSIMRNLLQQRDQISGVDINEQAAKMMIFERMFQAMAKYMNTVTATQDAVMNILQ